MIIIICVSFQNSFALPCRMLSNFIWSSSHDDDRRLRGRIVSLLVSLDPGCEEDTEIPKLVAKELLAVDRQELEGRTQYYSNSLTHRIRNRVWQALLLLIKLCEVFILLLAQIHFGFSCFYFNLSVSFLSRSLFLRLKLLHLGTQGLSWRWYCFQGCHHG